MPDITLFEFDEHQVRVVLDDEGNPWWVAKDVCVILGYANTSDAVAKHVRTGQRRSSQIATSGAVAFQKMTMINEGGLYRLIMRSDLPAAEQFQDWVTDEVLPELRKTGAYALAPRTMQEALRAAADALDAKEAAERAVEAARPMIEAAERWLVSDTDVHIVEWAKRFGHTQKTAYEILRKKNIVFKQPNGQGGFMHAPKVGWEEYFEIRNDYVNGRHFPTLYITPEGQEMVARHLGWVG